MFSLLANIKKPDVGITETAIKEIAKKSATVGAIKNNFPRGNITDIFFNLFSSKLFSIPNIEDEVEKISVLHIDYKKIVSIKDSDFVNLISDPLLSAERTYKCATCNRDETECTGHFADIILPDDIGIINPLFVEVVAKVLQCICLSCGKFKGEELLKEEKIAITSSGERLALLSNKLADKPCTATLDCMFIKIDMKKTKEDINKHGNIWYFSGFDEDELIRKKSTESQITRQSSQASSKKSSEKESKIIPFSFIEASLGNISVHVAQQLGFSHGAHPAKMLLFRIIVTPPSVRKAFKTDEGKEQRKHAHTEIYLSILKEIKKYNGKDRQVLSQNIYKLMYSFIIGTSNKTYKNVTITETLKGKHGLFRKSLLGKRTDYNARSVVIHDPNLKHYQISIPREWAKLLTIFEVVSSTNLQSLNSMLAKRQIKAIIRENGSEEKILANRIVIRQLKQKYLDEIRGIIQVNVSESISQEILNDDLHAEVLNRFPVNFLNVNTNGYYLNIGCTVERHLKDGDSVFVNRQPTIHATSMMVFRVLLVESKAIGLPMAVTTPFNADFDGDELNVFPMRDAYSRKDAILKASIDQCTISNFGIPELGIVYDSLYAINYLSQAETTISIDVFQTILNNLDTKEYLDTVVERFLELGKSNLIETVKNKLKLYKQEEFELSIESYCDSLYQNYVKTKILPVALDASKGIKITQNDLENIYDNISKVLENLLKSVLPDPKKRAVRIYDLVSIFKKQGLLIGKKSLEVYLKNNNLEMPIIKDFPENNVLKYYIVFQKSSSPENLMGRPFLIEIEKKIKEHIILCENILETNLLSPSKTSPVDFISKVKIVFGERIPGRFILSLLFPPDFIYSKDSLEIRDGVIISGTLKDSHLKTKVGSILHAIKIGYPTITPNDFASDLSKLTEDEIYDKYILDKTSRLIDDLYMISRRVLIINPLSIDMSDTYLYSETGYNSIMETYYDHRKRIIGEAKRRVTDSIIEKEDLFSGLDSILTGKPELIIKPEPSELIKVDKIMQLEGSSAISMGNRLNDIVNAGVKGTQSNMRQMSVSVGLQTFKGKLQNPTENGRTSLAYPDYDFRGAGHIAKSFCKGLDTTDFLRIMIPGQSGMLDTALTTAVSGEMEKWLRYVGEEYHVRQSCEIYSGMVKRKTRSEPPPKVRGTLLLTIFGLGINYQKCIPIQNIWWFVDSKLLYNISSKK